MTFLTKNIIVTLTLVFVLVPVVTSAKELGYGASCGVNGEYKGTTSGDKCKSGLSCIPWTCDTSKKQMTYKCYNPNSSYPTCGTNTKVSDIVYTSTDVTNCMNGQDVYTGWKKRCDAAKTNSQTQTTLASCKRKAPTERGIFTRGLSDECLGCGNCSQCDVLQVISSITSFIFSLVGALAIFFIVNAGFSFALSGGNEEHLKKAKGALAAAIIGAILVLVAWALINTVLSFWLGYDANSLGNWAYPNFSCSSS